MKAFKGCVNRECSEYNKTRYNEEDVYCKKCGQELEFVCAGCWKVMTDNSERYCMACEAKRLERRENAQEAIVEAAGKVADAGMNVISNVPSGAVEATKKGAAVMKDIGKGALGKLKTLRK